MLKKEKTSVLISIYSINAESFSFFAAVFGGFTQYLNQEHSDNEIMAQTHSSWVSKDQPYLTHPDCVSISHIG